MLFVLVGPSFLPQLSPSLAQDYEINCSRIHPVRTQYPKILRNYDSRDEEFEVNLFFYCILFFLELIATTASYFGAISTRKRRHSYQPSFPVWASSVRQRSVFGKTRLRAGIRHPHTDQWFGGLMSGVPLCLGLGSRRSLSSRFAVYLLPSRARSTLTTSSLHLQEL